MARTHKPKTRMSTVSYAALVYTFETPTNAARQVQVRKVLARLMKKHRLNRKHTVESSLGSLMEYYDRKPRNTPSYNTLEGLTGIDLSRFYE